MKVKLVSFFDRTPLYTTKANNDKQLASVPLHRAHTSFCRIGLEETRPTRTRLDTYYVVVTWLSRGCHVVVTWLSRGCHVVVTWLSCGCRVVFMWCYFNCLRGILKTTRII